MGRGLQGALSTLAVLVAVALTACGGDDGPHRLLVGAVDDVVRSPDPAVAGALLDEAAAAGLDAIAISSFWEPGLQAPTPEELAVMRTVAAGAEARGLRLFVAVYHRGSASTPLTEEARSQFAAYAAALAREVQGLDDLIVGNEPNLNRFWLPQFGPEGESLAPAAYALLLGQTYDAVKAAADVRVWGGATSPRGGDNPGGARPTHSPTRFLEELGAAYRASGRDAPLMDGYVHHPYPETSATPVDLPHPLNATIGLADYGKLVELLGDAFDGTAQEGSGLPIVYGELGIETEVPPEATAAYAGAEPARTVTPKEQAAAYRRALELAACQDTVEGILVFHVRDEPDLAGWQSGVRTADGAPKASLEPFRQAAAAARAGDLDVRCEP
ncbi:MAG TPA: hypothetical protein VFR43_01300 [Gaiellaceae bacterium]|nr:hypothetical protein [Gaiellaceae bacterium]